MSKGKVLIIVGDATETVGSWHPRDHLDEAGVKTVVAPLAMPLI